jgi:DNA repair exonuclease SbcCD nuclease subunit
MHFGVRQNSPVFLENQKKFFKEIFFPTLEKEGIDTVFDLGDTFDNRKIVNFDVLYQVKKFFFDEMRKRQITYHAIVGNHTVTYKNTNRVNAMDLLLNEYDNFHLYINDPVEIKLDNTKFILVPWLTADNYERSMSILKKSDAAVVCGHFDIVGFEMMKGQKSEHGLDRKVFSKFFAVYSGHYHHPSKSGNIEYLGAPYEMNWGDAGGKRGFHIFDCETQKKTFVENPFKMHIVLEYDDEDLTKEEIEELDANIVNGAFVKVNVKSMKTPHLLNNLVDKLGNAANVIVSEVPKTVEVKTFEMDENKGISDLIDEYLEAYKVETGADDAMMENVKTKIKDLYAEAMLLEDA